MAKGEVVVSLSGEDRRLLRRIADALDGGERVRKVRRRRLFEPYDANPALAYADGSVYDPDTVVTVWDAAPEAEPEGEEDA